MTVTPTGTPILISALATSVANLITALSYAGVNVGASNATPSDTGVTDTINNLLATRVKDTGDTMTGALNLTAAGTALAVTNNATVGGTLGVTGATTAASLQSTGTGTITAGSVGSQSGFRLSPIASGAPTLAVVGPAGAIGMNIATQSGGTITALAPLAVSSSAVLSGTTFTPLFSTAVNITGTLGGTSELVNIFANSDTANLTTADTFPLLKVNRQFGGTGTGGGRSTGLYQLTHNVAIPSGGSDQQYNTLLSFYDATVNAGGTSLTAGSTKGSAAAFYPQTNLRAGATNYTSAVTFEADISITPTIQQLTVGGTIANGDVITLTFTSASDIPGSPVAVTYAAGTGNTATHIVNGLMAAINANANLQTAGVCGMQHFGTSTILDICWQTQTTVTVAVATTGAETLSLGSVVGGASARTRQGGSVTRGNIDGQQGIATDVGFSISSLAHAPISGGFQTAYQVGSNGVWPVAWNGTIFGAGEQTIMNTGAVQGPFSPAKAQFGLDLQLVNFSGASIRVPGIQASGTGVLSVQNATLKTDTSGLTIDVVGKIGSGNPAIVGGGGGGSGVLQGNYFVGDIVKDANGGQYLVAGVNNSTGAVTSLTTLVQPSTATASLGTAIATTGGSGAGLTITPTGVANRTINLGTAGTTIAAPLFTNAANDAAAATASVPIGGFYRNGSLVVQRVASSATSSIIAALTSALPSLPTTLPGSAGVLWINGGVLSVS